MGNRSIFIFDTTHCILFEQYLLITPIISHKTSLFLSSTTLPSQTRILFQNDSLASYIPLNIPAQSFLTIYTDLIQQKTLAIDFWRNYKTLLRRTMNPISNLLPSPTETIAKLQHFHTGNQDAFLNPFAFTLQFLSTIIQTTTNVNNTTSTGLSNIANHINSSRFVLRFLTGVRSIHMLIQDKDSLLTFYNHFVAKKLGLALAKTTTSPLMSSSTVPYQQSSDFVPILRYLQSFLNLLYNLTELPAYVKSIAPMMANYDGDRFSRYSCAIWFLITLIEAIITLISRFNGTMTPRDFKLTLIPIICDLLLSSNWSLHQKDQFLSPFGILIAGMISSYMQFFAAWRSVPVSSSETPSDKYL